MAVLGEKSVLAILLCVGVQHDLRLVILAALICAVGAATAMQAVARAQRTERSQRAPWLLLAGAAGGAGVWATHFVAMLAFSPGLQIQFGLKVTVISLVIAIVGACAAFLVAETGKGRPVAGGALLGASVAAMHYCGVEAIHAVLVRWDFAYVAGSLVASVAGAVAAMWIARQPGLRPQIAAPAVLVLGIVGLHFTAMTAMTVTPDLTIIRSPELISRPIMAVGVGVVVLFILAGAASLIMLEARSRRTSHRTLEAVFQSTPEGAVLFDPVGRIVMWNTAFEALITDMGATIHAGDAKAVLFAAIDKAGWIGSEAFTRLRTPADDPLRTTEGPLPDGRILRIERRRLDDGSLLSLYADITEQRRASQAMEEARRKAEAANRAKSEFLANMSHELRTPLNGVLGMIQAIQRDDLAVPQRARLEVAHDSARALLVILDDILDLAKIEAGRNEVVAETFHVADLVLSICSAFSSAAVGKGLALTPQVSMSAGGWRHGDAGKLRRILGHLIDNGLKFTSVGGVKVDVSSADGLLTFRVKDTGIGLDPAQSARLFDRFVQGDTSDTRQYGGSGLGLSLCREWTEAIGGTLSADGLPGKGACFTLRVPMPSAEAPVEVPDEAAVEQLPSEPVAEPVAAEPVSAEPSAAEAEGSEERPLRVLAAEDNETNQLVLRSLLQAMQVDLTLVENGRVAVDAFARSPYDLVLMDIQMPEMNGVDAAKAIRAFETEQRRGHTPIIALTANVMPDQVAEYRAAGMDDCVAKPIELERLYNAMAGALSGTAAAA